MNADSYYQPEEPKPSRYRAPPYSRRGRIARAVSDLTIYVERPLPFVGDGAEFIELDVFVDFDEGRVYAATLENGAPIELTRDEKENAEVQWSEEFVAREEAAEEDDADRRRDR